MSHALIVHDFADGSYSFALYLGQWEELQEITGYGPLETYQKLGLLQFRARWPREIIRLGLIGGGMRPVDAKKMVERYVDTRPFSDSLALAIEIVGPSCYPVDKDADGEKKEIEANGQSSSNSASSTETVQ